MRNLLLLFLIVTLMAVTCSSPPSENAITAIADLEASDLEPYITVVRSIDPSDEDFSDLQPLRHLIGDARIVILGEATHGDGETFRAKGRLVRFLHQEMGFDVLAFETGVFSVQRALRGATSPEDILKGIDRSIYSIWSRSEEARNTLEYVASTYGTDRELQLVGMDAQFRARDTLYITELEEYLRRIDLLDERQWRLFAPTAERMMVSISAKTGFYERRRFRSALRNLIGDLERIEQDSDAASEESRYWLILKTII